MVSRLTKFQLIVFAIITVIGGAFVGGRYAQLDRYVVDRTYTVTMDLETSGSIFTNAEVTYRGVGVGRVGAVSFVDQGVQVELDIENDAPNIPADTEAIVANKSAVGEQYVDLRPRSAGEPFLADGDRIDRQNTAVPLQTHELMLDLAALLGSLDADDLNTVITELGTAFEGTGDDLRQITQTSTEFIDTASANLDLTRDLIRTSNSVLQTQIDSGSSIQSFSRDLRLFTDTMVEADGDLREILDNGPSAMREVDAVIAENHDGLTTVLSNVRTTTEPLAANVLGLRALLALFPLIVEGAYGVASMNDEGNWEAHFGLVLPGGADDEQFFRYDPPDQCTEGYPIHERYPDPSGENRARGPHALEERPVEVSSDCAEPAKVPRTPRSTIIDGRNAYDIPRAPAAVDSEGGLRVEDPYDGTGPWGGPATGPGE